MKMSNIAVNFRLEFSVGQAVMNKAVKPHLMTVSRGIFFFFVLCTLALYGEMTSKKPTLN